jgi:hypothetical protein
MGKKAWSNQTKNGGIIQIEIIKKPFEAITIKIMTMGIMSLSYNKIKMRHSV